ncbi:inositol 1,4,5-trisphosphate-gated calcium channel ITPR3-like isoform X3 [Babylonia areolata]|uniref:inositol 1,4,5-trisphosphate-gated calcium channel ITPR3-like isoform X3 n=1 Tax=Babylonia areolata TaxID=304850 RepID=UPI003FD0450E
MDDTLSIGDIVCLYSEERLGFMYSSQTSNYHNEVAVGYNQDRARPRVADQHIIAFEICAASRYKLTKKYHKLRAQSDQDPDNLRLKNTVAQAKIAADAEQEDNDLEQKRNQGKKVLYGHTVQLRHLFTRRYIHVSTTKTSRTESNNMAVELQAGNAKHAQFRIMPRYKVKAEGDVVQVDDQIVLESVKSPGQFLHVSQQHLGSQSVYGQSFELNLSVRQSGFTLYRKYKPSDNDEVKIKVGDPVRFYHKEMEAYLVAEGLFDDELTEDVHLRMRPVDPNKPKTLFPSSSAITYWQIELQEGPVAGGILKWEQQCRIVHMCTRRYLAVGKNGEVSLTTDNNDPSTVFRLHAVIRDSDDISFEAYARIEHVLTGFWLHALADEYQKRQDNTKSSDDRSMSGLKYTSAQLKKVAAIQEKQYDDAFTLQFVEPELVEIFHYMAGMVPFIQKLVSDKKAGAVLNAKMAHDVISSLVEMEDFMVDNSVPSKNRQKLMRNLRVVEQLVSLLKVPYMGSPDQAHLTNIFVEAYNVLYTYLMGDSRKNELYIAKYIDFFLTQFEYKAGKIGLNAAHMVMELIRDNRKIVDRITEDHIDKFVELLKRDKNYRYLELLSVLCVCDGVSIADNQAYITQKWLGGKDQKSCVYLTDLGEKIGKTKGVVYVSTNNGKTWKELKHFAQENMEGDEEVYLFLERQLELFGMLCHGQNEYAIQQITKELDYLSWNEAFTCLSDTTLPDRLRAKYCELIITLFVDIGDNVSVVDRVKLSYNYDDIDTSEIGASSSRTSGPRKDKVDKSSSQTYQYFPALRDWITIFLGTNGDMTASQIGNNMLVQQVLRLVHYLVKYGFYYKSTDIKLLLEPLMSLLDGRNDKPYPNMDGKEAEEVLHHFRKQGRFQKSQETKAIVDAKIQALEVLSLFFNFIFNLRMEKFMNMFKETHSHASLPLMPPPELGPLLSENFEMEDHPSICKAALRRLQDIFSDTAFFRDYEITEILMDLSHYDYDEMVRKSMQLLNRYFSAHRTLFTRAVQAQVLITDASVVISSKLSTLLPALRRLATAKLTNDQAEELGSILDHLILFCHLDDELEEQHNMNQSILYNHGVLEDAFTILTQNIDVKLLDQYEGLRRVFQKTFMLLRAMARGNRVVQGRLFDRLDMLLSKEGAAAELSECLTEVFTGNSNTCMKVMSHQVQRVMSLVAQHRQEIPQFLDLLNAIVKVEELDLPLKRNQSFVMTYFMQYRADIATVIDRPEQERELILTGKDSKELNYLIAMVDLLATCAEGENRYIESICQTIFKIEDLLKVLNHTAINCNLKRPFLRFFLWVFLNTAGGMIESGAGDLPHDPQLWKYVDSLNADLQRMAEFATANPDTVKQLLKRPPAKSNDSLNTRKTRVSGSGHNQRGNTAEEEMRAMMHYYFDAVMPFLQIFCRSYYQPDKEAYPEEPTRLSTLTLTFEKFMDAIAPLISIERQLKNLVTSMTSLITASNAVPLNKMEEFHQKYGGGTGSQDVRSDARKKYEDYYSTEEDINAKLNVFSVNMQMAYGGINNVQAQIGFPSQAEYSEMGGDEELPLGQEFQEHLKCFVNDRSKEPKDRYRMAQKLVKQLEISQSLQGLSEEEKLEQLELDVKCLQLMRGLIHNEIVKLPKDWELAMNDCKKQLRVIENVQTALDSYNVVVSVLGHLSRPQDDLVRELLAFLATLLFSGNEDVQKSMFGYFTGTREETFFFAVKNRMQLSALATREKRLLHAMHMAKVEELVAQAKALRKAMKEGKAGATDMLIATQLGSMLSVARRSRSSLNKSRRNMRGSRLSVNNRNALAAPRGGKQGGGMLGSTLAVPGQFGLQPNGSMMLGGGDKPPKIHRGKKTNEVAPVVAATQDSPEIKLDDLDEEEMLELTDAAVGMSDDLDFKDDGYIELVLRVLGLMCDNQHRGLQDYLREQPDNIKSVNLVAETTRFLNILYGNVNDKTAPLIIQLFDTLVEFASGNFHNQAIVFDNKVCEYVNHMLRVGHFKGCDLEQVYSLKKSIATLIRALSEENPPDMDEEEGQSLSGQRNVNVTRSSAVEVLEYIDSDVLMLTMVQAYQDMQKQGPQWQQVHNLVTDVGFVYYHTICRKMDLHPSCSKQSLVKTDQDALAWEFFEGSSLSIEILKDDVLQKINFRVKDKNVLREEIKEKFKYSVDRTSPSNKLRDFMDWSVDIIKDIKYQRRIYANPLARFFVQSMWWLNPLVLLVTFILCMIVMITWKAPASTSSAKPDLDDWPGAQLCIYIFGGIHNLLSLFIVISYFLSNHPTFPGTQDVKDLFLKVLPARKSSGDGDDDDDGGGEKRDSHLEVHFFSMSTFYYLLFLAFSILGTAFYGYFFPFHLLHMALMNQLLQRVILAVTRNGVSLVLVAILGLAIIFMFSLLAFGFYREYLDSSNGRHCRTAYECFVTIIHHGFVEGMYTTFEQQLSNLSFEKTMAIVAFDVIFFILITTIGLNIIFGIIVDTFSELRDSKWQIDNDMKSNCFICSRESYDFERQAGGFEKHVKEEHNQWAYLFFFIHLDETRPNDYSALELHVHRLLEKNNFDFFPLNRALSLAAEEDSSERKLETLMAQVEYLVAKMKEEEAMKEREKEKQRQQEWESKHKAHVAKDK